MGPRPTPHLLHLCCPRGLRGKARLRPPSTGGYSAERKKTTSSSPPQPALSSSTRARPARAPSKRSISVAVTNIWTPFETRAMRSAATRVHRASPHHIVAEGWGTIDISRMIPDFGDFPRENQRALLPFETQTTIALRPSMKNSTWSGWGPTTLLRPRVPSAQRYAGPTKAKPRPIPYRNEGPGVDLATAA